VAQRGRSAGTGGMKPPTRACRFFASHPLFINGLSAAVATSESPSHLTKLKLVLPVSSMAWLAQSGFRAGRSRQDSQPNGRSGRLEGVCRRQARRRIQLSATKETDGATNDTRPEVSPTLGILLRHLLFQTAPGQRSRSTLWADLKSRTQAMQALNDRLLKGGPSQHPV